MPNINPLEDSKRMSLVAVKKTTSPKIARATQLSHRTLGKLHLQAAQLEAVGKINREICQRVGITPPQLHTMRHLPKYREEVERVRQQLRAQMSGSILGSQMRRVELRDQLYLDLQYIREKRAELAEKDQELVAQGGLTGLVLTDPKYDRNGDLQNVGYSVDHETIDQIKSLANSTARDLGQLNGDKRNNNSTFVNVTLSREDQGWL
jgi:hypothetical protein